MTAPAVCSLAGRRRYRSALDARRASLPGQDVAHCSACRGWHTGQRPAASTSTSTTRTATQRRRDRRATAKVTAARKAGRRHAR
jgi:hypothetical protein